MFREELEYLLKQFSVLFCSLSIHTCYTLRNRIIYYNLEKITYYKSVFYKFNSREPIKA